MTEAIEAVMKRLHEVKNQIQSIEDTIEKQEKQTENNKVALIKLKERQDKLERAIKKLQHG